MARVMRTQVDVVLDDGVAVLNAADERVAALAAFCDGEVILYAADPQTPALLAHRGAGGRAVHLHDGRPVLATRSTETRLAPLSRQARAGYGRRDPARRDRRRVGAGHPARTDHRRHRNLRCPSRDLPRSPPELFVHGRFPHPRAARAPTCGAGTRPSRPS
jgi:hypothetical protein